MFEKGPPLRLLSLTSLDVTILAFLFLVSVPCVRADMGERCYELGWKRHAFEGYHRHQHPGGNLAREPTSTTLQSGI